MAQVELVGIKKRFGDFQAVHGIDLMVKDGEFVVFVGPSGCGKSTALRMICGLETLSTGDVRINGKSVRNMEPSKRGAAMVFQSYALYPHMTIAENMGFSLRMDGVPKAERAVKVKEAAKILQIDALLHRKPKELSGGQRQRVAIGRAIVRKPEVFLFDEPLSNLDAELRVQMRFELAKLHSELGSTIIYVTHDQVEAMTLADRIVVLRDGRVEQVGSPMELYRKPVNSFVAGFIGSPRMNFLDATVAEASGAMTEITFPGLIGGNIRFEVPPGTLTQGQSIQLGIRPESLKYSSAGDRNIEARIEFVELLGSSSYAYAPDFKAGPVIAAATFADDELPVGKNCQLNFFTGDCMLFASDGTRIATQDIN